MTLIHTHVHAYIGTLRHHDADDGKREGLLRVPRVFTGEAAEEVFVPGVSDQIRSARGVHL